MEVLLELLRGQPLDPNPNDTEWETVFALAEQEHVLPYAAAQLRSRRAALSPRIMDLLNQIDRDAAQAAFYWTSELRGLLRAFHQAGIPAVPLKGPCLAERLYGSAALRVSRDLDLLVSQSNLPQAEAVLAALGFVPGAPDHYQRPWRRETTMVELHHDVENPLAFNFHVESALHRVRPATFQGEPTWLLAPEDELLFLCLHAVRHRFDRLSLVLDLRFAFEKLPNSAEAWQPRADVAELNALLTLGLAVARHLQPDLASIPLPSPQPRDQHLAALADRLWQRLLTQPSEPLDWSAVHAFYLEIEPPGWPRIRRRYRHLRIFLGRAIDRDYAYAARLGLHRDWQVRLMRPLRLLSERLHRESR
jgi:hypothetical protein